jgi:hypothetical protein
MRSPLVQGRAEKSERENKMTHMTLGEFSGMALALPCGDAPAPDCTEMKAGSSLGVLNFDSPLVAAASFGKINERRAIYLWRV